MVLVGPARRCQFQIPLIPICRRQQICTKTATVGGLSSKFMLTVEPYSCNVLTLHLGSSPSSSGGLQRGAAAAAVNVAAA